MSPVAIDSIGMLAACFTTLCWAPQAIRIIRTRDARAVSLVTQAAFACGIILWLVYGIALGALPIILANAITLALVLAILVLKLRFG
ncbi:MAG: SemiSWEET transporter [Beijerinckiaceae bacterium]